MNYICASEYMSSHHVQVYTKLQCDQLPVGSVTQWVQHCTGIGHGLESLSGLNFFQALISQLLLICVLDDQACLHELYLMCKLSSLVL